jgi:malate permease and related proteins
MFVQSFFILLPLFILILSGFIMGRLVKLAEDTILRILADFFMPALVFSSLYLSPISPIEMLTLSGSVLIVLILTLIATLIYSGISSAQRSTFTLPVIFMNSGFLGIPLMQLWGGNEAMNIIIIYDQIQTFLIFTLGYLLLEGGFSSAGIKASIKSPILWAVVAGFMFNLLNISVPESLIKTFSFAGNAAPPLAAFALGHSLSGRKKGKISIHVITGILLRFAGGFLCGLIAVKLFNIEGLMKTVILVTSALPAAVFSYILPARLGYDSSIPREIVIISTILGVFTIPLSFYLAELI